MNCPVCNRPLKSKKSIEKGIGPVCEKKQKENENQAELELQVKE
ncbi:DUF6011 domain-containing protein [Fictibacillus sp. 18YEL24]|nr:DUF6011 domain-containing protein [Fictibacillus sp. 18YEL24]